MLLKSCQSLNLPRSLQMSLLLRCLPCISSFSKQTPSHRMSLDDTRVSLSDMMKQLRFESGEATITSEGYQVLDELIAHLKTAAGDRLIRVEGHADNQEIGPSLKSHYETNWHLSKARAGGVLAIC